MEHGRSTKRYSINQPLLVRCDSWGEFVALYATDISQGGMFIVTDESPAALSEIDIVMRLPEGHEVPLRGRVVHVIEPEHAAHMRRDPGVGIELIDLDDETRAQIHQLIDFARWQGSAHDPTATLASHLFEMSAHARPADVVQSLPSPPHRASARSTGERSIRPAAAGSARPSSTGSSGVRRASSLPASDDGKARRPRSGKPRSGAPGSSTSRAEERSAAASGSQAPSTEQPAAPPPKPTDTEALKVGITLLARKHLPEAAKHFQAMLADNPGDPEVCKWLHVTEARRAIASGNEVAARSAYEKVLAIAEDVHEARKFVRDYEHRKRLEAMPFGRFFMKKK